MTWRVLLFLCGVCISIGGPQHPGGTMLEMLQDPIWFTAHAWVTAGFIALTAALFIIKGQLTPGSRAARAMKWALPATIFQTIEMGLHTAAYVDAGHLAAGHATPVLTTHLTLALFAYPIWGFTMIAFVVAAMRDRAVGSPYIGWLGIIGLAAHGLSVPLVMLANLESARILFPMIMLFALWTMAAAMWPAHALRASAGKPATV